MTSISKARPEDFKLLSKIGRISFIETHEKSPQDVINNYVEEKFNPGAITKELSDLSNIYHLIFSDGQPAGYSKIIYNSQPSGIQLGNVTKLERIYLLKEFYGLKLGNELLDFNLKLSKENNQDGMWLYIWKENQRAFNFYKKNKFTIIGSYDFKLSEQHANPNHVMFLKY
jgi:ribosomal protein S18 acetylase RimI-like enzyme